MPRESRIRPSPICCDTRSRWPWLAPDSWGARGRSRERRSTPPKDSADARPRHLRIGGGGVGSVVGKSVRRPDSVRSTALEMSNGRDVSYAGGFALALAGDITRSESLANDLERQYPRDTLVRFTYVPTLRALAASRATSRPWPSNCCRQTFRTSAPSRDGLQLLLWKPVPVYVRGQAYAASGQPQQAAPSFRRSRPPGLMMGDPAGARARLEKARSLARTGDRGPLERRTRTSWRCGRTPTSMCRFWRRRSRTTRNCNRKLSRPPTRLDVDCRFVGDFRSSTGEIMDDSDEQSPKTHQSKINNRQRISNRKSTISNALFPRDAERLADHHCGIGSLAGWYFWAPPLSTSAT